MQLHPAAPGQPAGQSRCSVWRCSSSSNNAGELYSGRRAVRLRREPLLTLRAHGCFLCPTGTTETACFRRGTASVVRAATARRGQQQQQQQQVVVVQEGGQLVLKGWSPSPTAVPPASPSTVPKPAVLQPADQPQSRHHPQAIMDHAEAAARQRLVDAAPSPDDGLEAVWPDMWGVGAVLASRGRCVVVGAGPSGSATAACLAKRGYHVKVFERRARPRDEASTSSPHAYPMLLSARALQCMQEAGMQLPCVSAERRHRGSYIAGRLVPARPDDPHRCGHLVDRNRLAQEMIADVEARFPAATQVNFGYSLEGIDFFRRVAYFRCLDADGTAGSSSSADGITGSSSSADGGSRGTLINGNTIAVEYDLLVGADGTMSAVRGCLQAGMHFFNATVQYRSHIQYKTFSGLRWLPGDSEMVPGLAGHGPGEYLYAHVGVGQPAPASNARLMMFQQQDGVFSGVLSCLESWDAEHVQDVVQKLAPSIPQRWVQAIVAHVSDAAQEASTFGQIVQCNQLHGPRVVLLGDAGHPVTSMLGQGCNSALESVHVLCSVLDRHRNNLGEVPAQFTRARLKDVHAVQKLELMAQAMLPLRGKAVPWLDRFVSTMAASTCLLLHRILPAVFPSGNYVFAAMADARNSYRRVLLNVRLLAALGTLSVAAVAAVAAAAAVAMVRLAARAVVPLVAVAVAGA